MTIKMEATVYSFEKLEVWKESRFLVKLIYKYTQSFPKEEIFGLTGQLRRAAISISSNIAEGAGRKTKKDQAHFYTISYGSLMELLNQLIISVDLNYLNLEILDTELRPIISKISIKLYGLKNRV
jgi:four helix bundle protein